LGPHSAPNPNGYAYTNHVLGNGCDNARAVDRKTRAHDDAANAMRAYTQEAKRLNRQRRSSSESARRDHAEAAKAIAEIVRVIEQGGWHRALSDRLTELETKQDSLTAR
jgi:hypothetical protein